MDCKYKQRTLAEDIRLMLADYQSRLDNVAREALQNAADPGAQRGCHIHGIPQVAIGKIVREKKISLAADAT